MRRKDADREIPGAKRTAKPVIAVYDAIEQGTDEWFRVRLGIITASHFADVMATGRDDTASIGRRRYMHRLAAERITGEPHPEGYKNRAMERGKEMEPMAREQYERDYLVEAVQVGFVTREVGTGIDRFLVGASPDSLIGEGGGLEIKSEQPDLLVHRLERGLAHLPPEHRAQCQGNIWVSDRSWWDLKIYWPKMPRFVVRFHRDDKFIAELERECERFEHELTRLVERLRRMGS